MLGCLPRSSCSKRGRWACDVPSICARVRKSGRSFIVRRWRQESLCVFFFKGLRYFFSLLVPEQGPNHFGLRSIYDYFLSIDDQVRFPIEIIAITKEINQVTSSSTREVSYSREARSMLRLSLCRCTTTWTGSTHPSNKSKSLCSRWSVIGFFF